MQLTVRTTKTKNKDDQEFYKFELRNSDVAELPTLPVQIWTTDSNLKIKSGLEYTFNFIKFGPVVW